MNVGMVMGLLPVVGVPLPLVSYGGSAMLTVMVAYGLIFSVAIHRNVNLSRSDAFG
ncbi:MAG: FtsW/RodA/SpoVE family cell cycle protein [Sphingomonadales bacterium]